MSIGGKIPDLPEETTENGGYKGDVIIPAEIIYNNQKYKVTEIDKGSQTKMWMFEDDFVEELSRNSMESIYNQEPPHAESHAWSGRLVKGKCLL